jgi:hypothetical protein
MKRLLAFAVLFSALQARGGDVVVRKVQGEVTVRHGVTETWTAVAAGDVLRPDDTMRTGKKGGAVILTPAPGAKGGAQKTIAVPAEVVVDISDIRELSQEELMLKLTMEKVRASSYQWKNDELHIPNSGAVHGADRTPDTAVPADLSMGVFQMNGARLLFNNGFYATCALKGMEIFRQYPALGAGFDNHFLVAQALEKANLKGEALTEYGALSARDALTPEQRSLVRSKIERLQP